MGLVAWVDPFAYFDGPTPISRDLKVKNLYHDGATMPFYNMLWKIIEYRRHPVENIIIVFDTGLVADLTGRPLYNFGVPGGNFPSMFSIFWYADSLTTLRTVYLQVSFRNYSAGVNWDIYTGPRIAAGSSLYYLTNRSVLGAAWLNLRSRFFGKYMRYDDLPPDHWANVLRKDEQIYTHFSEAPQYLEELQRVAVHCRKRGIRLVLIDIPTYDDVHLLINRLGMASELERYREHMKAVGTYYDMQGPSALTRRRADFQDPLHPHRDVLERMIHEIWEGPLVNGTVYGEPLSPGVR
jgi:hypothetical protein